jgi:hypothetical protein
MADAERRRSGRRIPAADEPLSRVRLRAGRELTVVDVSNGGVLVEGQARLLPGTHADVHIVTKDGRTLVRSRVVRAWVCDVQADMVRYRGALAFDRAIDTEPVGYALPDILVPVAAAAGNRYPDPGTGAAAESAERLSA